MEPGSSKEVARTSMEAPVQRLEGIKRRFNWPTGSGNNNRASSSSILRGGSSGHTEKNILKRVKPTSMYSSVNLVN